MSALTFEPATHTYRLGGRVLPSVTQVLGGLYSFAGVPIEVLELARERGTDVHLACAHHDIGAPYNLPGDRMGYLQAWGRFIEATEPNWSAVEQPMHSNSDLYAGTPDRIGELRWRGALVPAVVDIKTAATPHPAWGVQTAGYARLWRPWESERQSAGAASLRRLTVRLSADGTYQVDEWTDPTDWPVFASLLTLYRFKERHRL